MAAPPFDPALAAFTPPQLPAETLVAWFEQSHDLLVLTDAAGGIVGCNPAFARAVGTAAVAGTPLQALLIPDVLAGTEPDAIDQALAEGAVDVPALQLVSASRGRLSVRARALRFNGQTLWTLLDVTEHRETRDALRHAAERTALIAHQAGIGTWDVDLDGMAEHWDEQMFRLRNLEPRDRAPSREERLALVHPDDLGHVVDASPEQIGSDGVTAYEFRVRLPDGSYRWLASRSASVVDGSGRVRHRVGVNWDATESKRAALVQQHAMMAERENRAKSALLSHVSHELRTPLNAVLGFTQLLQIEARAGGPEGWADKLEHIRTAGERLLSLTTDLLDRSSRDEGHAAIMTRAGTTALMPQAAAGRAGRVLYIEDNPVNVMLVEQMVMAVPGLTLDAEVTGEAGVARARRLQPDLILVDMQLPDFDGYEVLRRLRAQPETADMRCIALSANAMPGDIARGLQAGFADYWTKPIDFNAFRAGLEALFPLRSDDGCHGAHAP